MRVAVVGLGKLGLPLAGFFLLAGHDVTGADVSASRLRAIADLDPEITREPELADALRSGSASGRWRTTTDTCAAVRSAETVVVIVPVHASGPDQIDLSMLDGAIDDVGSGLSPGTTVILESTVPVGTTRRRVLPVLERRHRHGADFWLAYSPERVSVGTVFRDLRTYPKIVGGLDAEARRRAMSFYQESLGLTAMGVASAETAEFVKLIETTYRDANIALSNSFAIAADGLGIDVSEAILSANSQPYSHIHMPGVGVGGNCIPVYPYLYAASVPAGADLALAARELNDHMVDHAIAKIMATYARPLDGAKVLILGVTYRVGVKDTANSSAIRLADMLRRAGAEVMGSDPLLSDGELRDLGFVPVRPPAYAPADIVIVQALSPEFADLGWLGSTRARVVFDGRNVIDPLLVDRAGAMYLGVGR